jgi:tRNA uridine 5-carbamoylmethylation protein Kti12
MSVEEKSVVEGALDEIEKSLSQLEETIRQKAQDVNKLRNSARSSIERIDRLVESLNKAGL